MTAICPVCNKKIGIFDERAPYVSERAPMHIDCFDRSAENAKEYGGTVPTEISEQERQRKQSADNVKLTTAFTFANYEIEDEVSIVTAECVFGMNVFRDFFAGMTDFFGGRSAASQKLLRDARNTCLDELKTEASSLGADGVMGIDLDYSEFSGNSKSMLFLVASGTAVKFKLKPT